MSTYSTLRSSRRSVLAVPSIAVALSVGGCAKDTSKLTAGDKTSASGGKTGRGGTSATEAGAAGESLGGQASGGQASGGKSSGGSPNTIGTGGATTPGAGGATSGGATSGGASSALSGGTNAAGGAPATGGTQTTGGSSSTSTGTNPAIAEVLDVGLTYSGQPTDYALVTVDNQQFVAYWNGETSPDQFKYLTVASRVLGTRTWTKTTLNVQIGNDAHHTIAMAADKKGYLHITGGMHNTPLGYDAATKIPGRYFRTKTPLDIKTFQLYSSMIGAQEDSVTYPQFFVGPIGDLVFAYRNGGSGNGDTYFNYFTVDPDPSFSTWNRLLNTKLIDGTTTIPTNSAYIVGPVKGPDNYWHLVWTWRENSNADSNHDLSYARTKDFKTWESAAGVKLVDGNATSPTPITLATADIVDHIPTQGGLINNNTKVGFDSQNRPVVVYHKYDSQGLTQLYNARFEGNAWVVHRTTNWTHRWDIGGFNTLDFAIEVFPVKSYPSGQLKQLYYNSYEGGWGGLVLNETTLAQTAQVAPPYPYPAELGLRESADPNMRVRFWQDSGTGPDPDINYMLRWETLPPNGDVARTPEPASSMLRVYGIRRSVMNAIN